MVRVHIIGGPGCGKTCAAREVSRRFGGGGDSLGGVYWDMAAGNYRVRRDNRERDEGLKRIAEGEGWVIEGVYYHWVGPSLRRADVIVVMRVPMWVRQWRVCRRHVIRKVGGPAESVMD